MIPTSRQSASSAIVPTVRQPLWNTCSACAKLAGISWVNLNKLSTGAFCLVREKVKELRPSGIVNGLCQYSSGEPLHDHPWWFITFVLIGGYRDHTSRGYQEMRRWKFVYRPANHKHAVIVNDGGCWTLLFTGPKVRRWGFWIADKFVKANKYFMSNGLHHCE